MDKTYLLSKQEIAIPVKTGDRENCLEIYDGEEKIFEFLVPVGNDKAQTAGEFDYDYVAGIYARDYIGHEITLKGDFSQGFFDIIISQPDQYFPDEKRPQAHFTPSYGWMNDPNGLIYDGKYYHMYFQHNPCNIKWNNMSWGHAKSTDLVEWTQLHDVMYPDENGTIFSGCGIYEEGRYYFPYTVAGTSAPWNQGKPFYQGLALSRDGDTFFKRKAPFLGITGKDSRDPKVFWHEDSRSYIMVLYLEGNDFGIFRSPDMMEWKQSQRFTVKKAWECPDLLRVKAKDCDDHRWMFACADGFYYWGDFDGYRFTSDFKEHHAFAGGHLYASQSFYGLKDRIVSLSWIRLDKRNGHSYQGAMAIPREYSYKEENGTCLLLQEPVREFRERLVSVKDVPKDGVYVVDLPIVKNSGLLHMEINGSTVDIDPEKRTLRVDDESTEIPVDFSNIELTVDFNLLEISFSYAIIVAYKIAGSGNSFKAGWRINGNIKGCGSQNRADCNYSIKSLK